MGSPTLIDISITQLLTLRLRKHHGRGGGKILVEGQDVCCEAASSIYDREAVHVKSQIDGLK